MNNSDPIDFPNSFRTARVTTGGSNDTTTTGQAVTILSLDGGGVRALFELGILYRLERAFNRKAADMFDLVMGVSAGAATAAKVAFGGYDDIRTSNISTAEVFESRLPNGPLLSSMYDGLGKRRHIEKVFGNDTTMGNSNIYLGILVASINGEPRVFSSHRHPDVKLAEVIDASTAAPVFYPPVTVTNPHVTEQADGSEIKTAYYMDGGVISNDPTLAAIEMARDIWGENVNISIVSIGTAPVMNIVPGNIGDPTQYGIIKWLLSGLLDSIANAHSSIHAKLVPKLIGDGNFARITSNIGGMLNDISDEMIQTLEDDAEKVWQKSSQYFLAWFKEKLVVRGTPVC